MRNKDNQGDQMKFRTKRELAWYIKGLEDAKESMDADLKNLIMKYKGSEPFMDHLK